MATVTSAVGDKEEQSGDAVATTSAPAAPAPTPAPAPAPAPATDVEAAATAPSSAAAGGGGAGGGAGAGAGAGASSAGAGGDDAVAVTAELADDQSQDPRGEWRKHSKHMFILNYVGRPVFARYGGETSQTVLMGVIQAVISRSIGSGQPLRSIHAGDHVIVFVLKDPLYLVAVSNTGEPVEHLRRQLEHMYGCIMFILTDKIFSMLTNKPTYDVRTLLGGTRGALLGVIKRANRSLAILFEAIPVVRLPKATRSTICHILQAARTKLVYGLVVASHKLVAMVQLKKVALHPFDYLQLTNFVHSAVKAAESFTPVCLPKLCSSKYAHAHVAFVAPAVCIMLVISSTAEADIMSLKRDNTLMVNQLRKSGVVQQIEREATNAVPGPEMHGILGLLHYVYKWDALNQFTEGSYPARFMEHKQRKLLLRQYQRMYVRMATLEPDVKQAVETTSLATIVGINTTDGCLLAAFDRLVSPGDAYARCGRLIKAVRRGRDDVFTHTPLTT